jgi:hypothetical protein
VSLFYDDTELVPKLRPWLIRSLMEQEYWRPIQGYDNYAVSSYGRVRSSQKIKLPTKNRSGYEYVRLWKSNRSKTYYVHLLVMEAFVSPRWPGINIHHVIHDGQFNQLDNLVYLTIYEHLKLHSEETRCRTNCL